MNLPPILSESVRYWEGKRLIYNAVLAAIVIVCWGPELPIILKGDFWQIFGAFLVIGIFAAIANFLFCFAYPVDLALQLTPLKSSWQQFRWILFAVGLAIAIGLALWVMLRPGMA